MEGLISAKSLWAREPTSEISTRVHELALGCGLCLLTKQLKTLPLWAESDCCWGYTSQQRRHRDYGSSFLHFSSGLHGSAGRDNLAEV